MRLGKSIIGGKPMRIPGIVDVYQRRDQWFARSWPRRAVQPDSLEQLYWRERYRQAQIIVNSFRGAYRVAWQNLVCPPGKCWIDVARSCALKRPDLFTDVNWPADATIKCYYDKDNFPNTNITTVYALERADGSYWDTGIMYPLRYGCSFDQVLRWDDDGWICPKGKRPKKKWKLSLKDSQPNPTDPPGQQSPYVIQYIYWEDRPFPSATYWMGRCPTGFTAVGLTEYIQPETGLKNWCLWLPPIYCPVIPWP